MTTKYVHNGKEVILTGRTAKKHLRSGKEELLHEIRPDGVTSKQYNSWVKMKDLFEINESEVEVENDPFAHKSDKMETEVSKT